MGMPTGGIQRDFEIVSNFHTIQQINRQFKQIVDKVLNFQKICGIYRRGGAIWQTTLKNSIA